MEKLIERLKAVADEMDALLAKDELSEEENVRFTELETESGELRTQIERNKEAAEVRRLAEDESNVERGSDEKDVNLNTRTSEDPYDFSTMRTNPVVDGPQAVAREMRGRALQAVERASDLTDQEKQNATRLIERHDDKEGTISKIVLATGGEDYRSAWGKLMTSPNPQLTSDETKAVERAMSLTDGAGGYAVPFTLDPTIILTDDGTTNPFRQISRVEKITTDSWNGVSSAGVTGSWDGEGVEVSDDSPTLAQPTVPAHKASVFVPYSIEIGQDFQNLSTEIAKMIAMEKDDMEAEAFATGSGVGRPTGIVTALAGTTSEIDVKTAETFAVADLYAVEEALGPKYRARASWAANKAIFNKVRQLDTQGGANLWVNLGAGQPKELLGYPAYEASAMDDSWNTAVTANNYIMVLGDFTNYLIADRVGLSIEFIPHLFHTANNRPSGQRGWYAHFRVGADSVNDSAFTLLDLPTTL